MKKIICFHLIVYIIVGLINVQTIYASNLRFYNYNTKSNVNYTGKQVKYIYNKRELPLEVPGIIINGTALADYNDLFVQELGLQATIKDKIITITDGTNTLLLTLGSKNAKLNNKAQTLSVAPVKLKFEDDTIKYYVPTRFVAEAFGFGYIWNSDTSSANLIKTYQLSFNNKTILYDEELYSISYKEQKIALDMPVISYDSTVFAPAKQLFESIGCIYEENDTSIIITKDDISASIEFNNDEAIVNNVSFSMEASPIMITDEKNNLTQSFVPLEFISKILGYELTYSDTKKQYTLLDTNYTGNPEYHPELKEYYKLQQEKEKAQQKIADYFEWTTEKTVPNSNPEIKEISKIVAYATEQADVLEIYGICRDDINDFIDTHTLVFEMENVISSLGTQFFVDFETPHLNYVFLKTISNTKMLFMIPLEDTWHFVEKEDCLQVYFTSADLSLEDLAIAWEEPENIAPVENDKIYPEDKLVIPLSETMLETEIFDVDNYLKGNFQIKIKGSHVSFFKENTICNPYTFVNNITIEYDSTSDTTNITCYTNEIYGYVMDYNENFLAITVDKPSKIYDKIVVFDAGHGGKDPGAIRNNIYEKNLNYNILYGQAKEFFEHTDIKVYYTRETDKFISLNDRAKFAAKVDADIFISLHMNASELTTAKGTQVFYSKSNNNKLDSGLNSYRLGKTLGTNISNAMETNLRGITNSDYYVVKYNSVPAVLVELGFISNDEERKKLTDEFYQKKAAEAIYQSVLEIFSAYPTGR